MNDIEKLRQWYIDNKSCLNFAGIEKAMEISPTYLVKFVKKGEFYESAVYGILKFALEKGFKFQHDQCGFTIDKKTCEVFFVQEVEGVLQWVDVAFEIGAIYDEYRRALKNE